MRVGPNDILFNDKCGTTVYSDANIFKVFLEQHQNSHLKPPLLPSPFHRSNTVELFQQIMKCYPLLLFSLIRC